MHSTAIPQGQASPRSPSVALRPTFGDRVRAVRDRVDLREVAKSLGLLVRGRSLKCPSHADGSPSASIGSVRWRCHACNAGGDAVDLLQAVRGGTAAEALAELEADLGLAQVEGAYQPQAHRQAPIMKVPEDRADIDREGLIAMWGMLLRLDGSDPIGHPPAWDGEVDRARRWLVSRGLDVDRVLALGGCGPRVVWPAPASLPSWAEVARRLGALVALPVFDHRGWLAGLRFRRITSDRPKELSGTGMRTKGKVLANPIALGLLSGVISEPRRCWIVEGSPDWASVATMLDHDAVLGIVAGDSFDSAIAARIPSGSEVCIATHADEPGNRYATRIAELLGTRCTLRRVEGVA